jgi:hypothetical protein
MEALMSNPLFLICAECREGLHMGGIFWSHAHRPPVWAIDGELERAVEGSTEYFLLAHRGHNLGVIDEIALSDFDTEEDPIVPAPVLDAAARGAGPVGAARWRQPIQSETR